MWVIDDKCYDRLSNGVGRYLWERLRQTVRESLATSLACAEGVRLGEQASRDLGGREQWSCRIA